MIITFRKTVTTIEKQILVLKTNSGAVVQRVYAMYPFI